jgi:hypothetical protein
LPRLIVRPNLLNQTGNGIPIRHIDIDNFLTPIAKMNSEMGAHNNHLRVAHLNTVSIPKHRDEIQRVICETDLDILCTSETNIKTGTPAKRYNIPGYKLIKKNREYGAKGGIGIYFKDIYKPKKIEIRYDGLQPELIFTEVEINKNKVAIGVIYKSPSTSYGIYAEIQEILAFITTKYSHVMILGDFNIDFLKNDRPKEFFKEVILQPFALHQVIKEPTRITKDSATLIDHIFVTNPESVKCAGVADFPGISDHCLVYMSYSLKRPKFSPTKITRRDFKNFNEQAFKADLERAPWGNILTVDENNMDIDINDKVTIIENIYKDSIEKHAPYREFTIKRPIKSSWMSEEILALMDTRDKYKNFFNRFKDDYFFDRYKELRNEVNHKIRRAKIAEFNDSINSKINDSRNFHKALKKHNVVSSKKTDDMQCPFSPESLNNTFCESHNAEVDLQKIARTINNINNKPRRGGIFRFQNVSEREVIEIVKSLKSNACGIDDISAYFVKLSIEHSASAITEIINSSLDQAVFPDRWKKALVIPIPKNNTPLSTLDYRPISLLSVLSKIIEKIAAKQMTAYLTQHMLFDNNQSAYRKNHGCPTALLKITDDLYQSMDNGEIGILVLLDYSKAFNCANHDIILAKLKGLGFSNMALRWINSYLTGRSQRVKTSAGVSDWKNLANGVPQGSILGPLLFTILLNDMKDFLVNCKFHLYADDSQIYITGKIADILEIIAKLNTDLLNISTFSVANNLSLNVGKCKYITVGSRNNLDIISGMNLPAVQIAGKILEREHEVYNLGVLLDENLTWDSHYNTTISKAYGKLKTAYLAKNFLDRKSKIAVVEYYVLSQLNYCNIIMQNISQGVITKIQKLQNACTRFIFNLRKYDHISVHFRQLNVLNMENRRVLHSATLMHKITSNKAPSYLCSKICFRNALHLHNTRGNSKLHIARYRNVYGRDRFFRKVAQSYNRILDFDGFSLGMSVANFKNKLKLNLLANQ